MEKYFPTIIITFLEVFKQGFSCIKTFSLFKSYIWGLLFVSENKCMTKVAHVCFFVKKHISSFERFLSEYVRDLCFISKALTCLLIKILKGSALIHGELLFAIDTTFVTKNSKKMIGVQKWDDHSGNSDRRNFITGHHWAICSLINCFKNRFLSWPILTRMISGHKNPSHFVSTKNGLRPAVFWDSIFAIINQLCLFLKTSSFRIVVDAYFAKFNFIQPMIDKGVGVVTRLRKDAVGWCDPEPYLGRGRPKKYGKKYKLKNLPELVPYKKLKVKIYGKETEVTTTSMVLWLRKITKKVKVVLIKTKTNPIILMSTDTKLKIVQIVEIYSSGFSIEIAIRDLKQHFGFGDYQCRKILPIIRFVRLSCVSFCL